NSHLREHAFVTAIGIDSCAGRPGQNRQFAGLLGKKRPFIAAYDPDLGLSFKLACFDAKGGKPDWVDNVWGVNRDGSGTGRSRSVGRWRCITAGTGDSFQGRVERNQVLVGQEVAPETGENGFQGSPPGGEMKSIHRPPYARPTTH